MKVLWVVMKYICFCFTDSNTLFSNENPAYFAFFMLFNSYLESTVYTMFTIAAAKTITKNRLANSQSDNGNNSTSIGQCNYNKKSILLTYIFFSQNAKCAIILHVFLL